MPLAGLAIAISRTMQFNERCPWRSVRSRIPNLISRRTLSRLVGGLCKTRFEEKTKEKSAQPSSNIYCKGNNGKLNKSWVVSFWTESALRRLTVCFGRPGPRSRLLLASLMFALLACRASFFFCSAIFWIAKNLFFLIWILIAMYPTLAYSATRNISSDRSGPPPSWEINRKCFLSMSPHGRSPEARHSLLLVVGTCGGGGKLNMVPV